MRLGAKKQKNVMISQEKAATEQEIMVLGARAVTVQKEQGLARSKIFLCSRQREPALHVGGQCGT